MNTRPQTTPLPLRRWDYTGGPGGGFATQAGYMVNTDGRPQYPSSTSLPHQGIIGQPMIPLGHQYTVVPPGALPYQLPGSGYGQIIGSYDGSVQTVPNNLIQHSSSQFNDPQRSLTRLPGRNLRENAVRAPRINDDRMQQNRQSAHNVVDPILIKAGRDVRTTVMLRNIPNKMNQAELKEVVDDSSFGKYDFMYLRIDFQNECNVGYAFINFVDALDIEDFWNARANVPWGTHGSNKIAEISYATIQGKDCLVSKFRNSSVMLEAPEYRPKVCSRMPI